MHLVYNEQTGDFEEVLYNAPPEVVSFCIDKPSNFAFRGDDVRIDWIIKDAEKITIDGVDVPDGVTSRTIQCEHAGNMVIELLASNPCGVTKETLSINVIEKPLFEINCSKDKLHKGKRETCVLNWNIQNALSITLIATDKNNSIDATGVLELSPAKTETLKFEALALDGVTTFSEDVTIGVFYESSITFTTDKYYVFPQIPILLSWKVKHAKHVWLGDEEVKAKGKKVVGQDKATTYILKVEDEFGVKEESIFVDMLPIPQVKSLLVPTPKITNNLSVTIKQPRFNVEAKFPEVEVMGVKLKMPEVPSLKDCGLMVNLSSPDLKRPSLIKEIKSLFQYYYNKVKTS